MMMRNLALIMCLAPIAASADSVLAARTIRAQTIITAADIVVKDVDIIGAAQQPEEIVGQESRVALYAGRAIRPGDVGPPAVIERNQIVTLVFSRYGLTISSDGRALMRGSPGDFIRIMNMSSRVIVSGRVRPDGRVFVSD